MRQRLFFVSTLLLSTLSLDLTLFPQFTSVSNPTGIAKDADSNLWVASFRHP